MKGYNKPESLKLGTCFICGKPCERYCHDYCAMAMADEKNKRIKEANEVFNGSN